MSGTLQHRWWMVTVVFAVQIQLRLMCVCVSLLIQWTLSKLLLLQLLQFQSHWPIVQSIASIWTLDILLLSCKQILRSIGSTLSKSHCDLCKQGSSSSIVHSYFAIQWVSKREREKKERSQQEVDPPGDPGIWLTHSFSVSFFFPSNHLWKEREVKCVQCHWLVKESETDLKAQRKKSEKRQMWRTERERERERERVDTGQQWIQ